MKNSEMKITELLNAKSDLEGRIARLERQADALNGKSGSKSYDCGECPTVEIYAPNQTYRSEIDSDLLLNAVEVKIERLESELEPVTKKLDAIELMLNS